MKRDAKKVVAATMGVVEYLKAERERARLESEAALKISFPPGDRRIMPTGSLWAASGRMEIMRFRNMMELRMFRRGR